MTSAFLIVQDRQKAAKTLVLQYRIERAAKRMGIFATIAMVLITIGSFISIFRPSHFYGV